MENAAQKPQFQRLTRSWLWPDLHVVGKRVGSNAEGMLTMSRYCGKQTRASVFHASRKGAQKFQRAKSKVQDTGAASKLRERADEIGTLEI